jgi:FAD/FMN-containing dehydrogenase
VSHTGVGGLTLGGGMGWLARQHGLSCDNLVSCEVVTADGRVLRASETDHPDLFWGLRGGGGNFGIVTDFEFALHPVEAQTLVLEVAFPRAESHAVLAGWRDLSASAPREATFDGAVGGDLVTVGLVWVGDPAAGRRVVDATLASLRELGRPVVERVLEPTYLELQTRDDAVRGHAFRRYWKGHHVRELSEAAIATLLARDGEAGPDVSLQAYGGAIEDVPVDATAFSQRGTRFELIAAARWTDPAEDEARIEAARRYAAALEPFASGAYVNALADEGQDGVRRAYTPAKLARLSALKDVYDPDNVFHLNQNIRPADAHR